MSPAHPRLSDTTRLCESVAGQTFSPISAVSDHSRCSSPSSLAATSAGGSSPSSSLAETETISLKMRDSKALSLEMTPLEAFVTCFREDFEQDRQLLLSQLNNLYHMRTGGRELKHRDAGYSCMSEFIRGIPGIELFGHSTHKQARIGDRAAFGLLVERVTRSLHVRIEELKRRGLCTDLLEFEYQLPQKLPTKLLVRIWELFRDSPNHEIEVVTFMTVYAERFGRDKKWFKALGYKDVRGLLAQVPFIEKGVSRNVDTEGRAVYWLKTLSPLSSWETPFYQPAIQMTPTY